MGKATKKQGFTLVELVVIIAIIVVLIAITIPSCFALRSKAAQKTCSSNRNTIVRMFEFEKLSRLEEYMTLEQYIATNMEYRDSCPAGGKYSTSTDNTIGCDKHLEENKNDETGETSEETIPWI